MTEKPRATPRVREHIDRLREAGFETAKFFDALIALRDDTALPKAHREALYKLIAMESFIWYLEALRNEPIDREKLLIEARKIHEEMSAAIRTPDAANLAEKLAGADVGKDAPTPAGETPEAPKAPAPPRVQGPKPAPRPAPPITKAPPPRPAPAPGPPKKKP